VVRNLEAACGVFEVGCECRLKKGTPQALQHATMTPERANLEEVFTSAAQSGICGECVPNRLRPIRRGP